MKSKNITTLPILAFAILLPCSASAQTSSSVSGIIQKSSDVMNSVDQKSVNNQAPFLNTQISNPIFSSAQEAGKQLGSQLKSQSKDTFITSIEAAHQSSTPSASTQPTAISALRVAAIGNPNNPADQKKYEQYVDHTLMQRQEDNASTFVFISLSMPATELEKMFKQVSGDKSLLSSTVFVVRGWPNKPQGMALMVSQIQRLMPSGFQPNVEINPALFKAYKVSSVPVITHKVMDGPNKFSWNSVDGITNIPLAITSLDKHTKLQNGPTVAISEPDIINLITTKMKSYNWPQTVKSAQDNSWSMMAKKLQIQLPVSQKALSYPVDPSIVVTKVISLPDGTVLARPGDKINPLTRYPFAWPQVYCVFDATSPWQIAQAKAWIKIYGSRLVLMTNHLPDNFQTWVNLSNSLGTKVSALEGMLTTRLGVHYVPSLIVPDNDHFDVTVAPEPPAVGLAKAAGYNQ